MPEFIVAQPTGRWAIYSTDVDDFTLVDADSWAVMDYLLDAARQPIALRMDTAKRAGGEIPWHVCCEWKDRAKEPESDQEGDS